MLDETEKLAARIISVLENHRAWKSQYSPLERHPSLIVEPGMMDEALRDFSHRLTGKCLMPPFFHPLYAGQMLSPPHDASVLGYLAALLINPSNYSRESGGPLIEMEWEVIREIGGMFHYPDGFTGHLTTSGTMANLEALWVSRQLVPGKSVAYSTHAHFTHARACSLLNISGIPIPTDVQGRMDINRLESTLRSGCIGTVVVTAGTPGLGMIDPIDEVLALREKYGFRLHVDAAYGGFFALLAGLKDSPVPREPFLAISECDSVTVDPHKHALQPFGCGCVLFRDKNVRSLYSHDAPYAEHRGNEEYGFEPGSMSLECSRAGASAAALWLTLQCLPLRPDRGLGPVLHACVRAARRWADLIESSEELALYTRPQLGIISFAPRAALDTSSKLDEVCTKLIDLMREESEPAYLSLLRVERGSLQSRYGNMQCDTASARIIRSVLMKPEHEYAVDNMHLKLINVMGKSALI